MSHPSTMASTLNTSSLRQSARQTRTNPVRNSKAIGRSLFTLGRQSSFASAANEPSTAQNHTSNNNTNEQHGFYPAIEAFTDALNTLPREYRRHVSLLKEVDAKAWATEEHVQTLLTAAPTIPLYADSVAASVAGATHDETQSQTFSQVTDPGFDSLRRHFFNELRYNLSEMMVSMDEKNHLISNAHDEVQRRLTRIETIHPWIDQELSDEARYGSLTHWAYFQQNPSKPTVAESGRAERTRREVAAANNTAPGNHDTETAARSESRREAMLARKQRLAAQHADSDFDDPRPQSAARRGANGGPRGKRVAEAAGDAAASGTAAAATAPKKRKVEKTAAAAAAAMERSTSNRLTSTAMSRETSNAEPTKKRARPAAGLTRKRCVFPFHMALICLLTSYSLLGTTALLLLRSFRLLSSARSKSFTAQAQHRRLLRDHRRPAVVKILRRRATRARNRQLRTRTHDQEIRQTDRRQRTAATSQTTKMPLAKRFFPSPSQSMATLFRLH